MFYVGIDWADQKHDVCGVDEKGERVVNLTIPHTAQGLSRLHRRLSMLIPNQDEMLLALDTDKGLVVSFLLDLGYTVYPINPRWSVTTEIATAPPVPSLTPWTLWS